MKLHTDRFHMSGISKRTSQRTANPFQLLNAWASVLLKRTLMRLFIMNMKFSPVRMLSEASNFQREGDSISQGISLFFQAPFLKRLHNDIKTFLRVIDVLMLCSS